MGRPHLRCTFSASSPKQQTHVTTSLGKIRNLVHDPSYHGPRPAQARPGTTMTVVPQNSKPAAEEKTAPTREAKAAHRHGAAARRFDERCRGKPTPAGGRDASRRPDARKQPPLRRSQRCRPPRCRRIERNTCQCTGWTRGATGRTDASTGGRSPLLPARRWSLPPTMCKNTLYRQRGGHV